MNNTDTAKDQAQAQQESIESMITRLNHAGDCSNRESIGAEDCELTDKEIIEGLGEWYKDGQKATEDQIADYHDEDKAREAIMEDPLSIQTRSDWHDVGATAEDTEFEIFYAQAAPQLEYAET